MEFKRNFEWKRKEEKGKRKKKRFSKIIAIDKSRSTHKEMLVKYIFSFTYVHPHKQVQKVKYT